MIRIFRRTIKDSSLKICSSHERSAWYYVINPSEDEKLEIMRKFRLSRDDMEDMLDEHERPLIDKEDDKIALIIRIPFMIEEKGQIVFSTIPWGIVINDYNILTVCKRETMLMREFTTDMIKDLYTTKRTRMLLQIFSRTNFYYMRFLRQMEKLIYKKEVAIKKLQNDDIVYLVEACKSLLFFQTSLTENGNILERIMSGKVIKLYEQDQDILEDIVIDNKQTIEMTKIFSKIISNIREAYSSILNNNLNKIMKFLAAMTVILTIPTIMGTVYGMNVDLPFQQTNFIFTFLLTSSLLIATFVVLLFYKKGWL
ncbi:MAG: magnesium transporter CorA family protein [Nanoarchaeota archaeon]|nr:magnesium transporter CorA family protein [Nanoarchaeota archaeon]